MEGSISTIRRVVVSVTHCVLSEAERHLPLVTLYFDKDGAVLVEHFGNGGQDSHVIVVLTEAKCRVSGGFQKSVVVTYFATKTQASGG